MCRICLMMSSVLMCKISRVDVSNLSDCLKEIGYADSRFEMSVSGLPQKTIEGFPGERLAINSSGRLGILMPMRMVSVLAKIV